MCYLSGENHRGEKEEGTKVNLNEIMGIIQGAHPDITLIGETIYDNFYFGSITRDNREAPGTSVFDCTSARIDFGGAASVAVSLDTLLGDQPFRFITTDPKNSWVCSRFVDETTGKVLFRADSPPASKPLAFRSFPFEHQNVIIADYGRGMLSWDAIQEISAEHGILAPHLPNCRTCTPEIIDALKDWLWVMNVDERSALPLGVAPTNRITTNGENLIFQFTGNDMAAFPVVPVEAVHTCGIGDCFLAALSAAHFSGVALEEAIPFAIELCRRVLLVKRPGTCYILEGELA